MCSKCAFCGIRKDQLTGQWWGLNNYYGLSGYCCPGCYEKISHDSYGNPQNPTEYTLMLLKNNKNFG